MKVAVTTLVFCIAALLALGMVMLYSSSMTQVGAHYLMKQLIWGALGLVAFVVAASVDYRILRKYAWVLYGIAVLMLALVLHHQFGYWNKGARRWFDFGGVRFQPSEFGKVALIIVLAWYGEYFQRQMHTFKRGIIFPGLIVGVVLILILKEPDFGSTILLAAVSGTMLVISGVRWRYILPPVLIAGAVLAFIIWHDPMRSERVYSWLHLEETKANKGHQAYQAMLAFGSGGWTGLGLGNGRQKLGFIPEHHTDFILSIIGEELGLVATLLVVLGFAVVICCGIYIAYRARDTFGLLLALGITLLIGLQAGINIGVVTGALPNKGLPLPFISYGGSNLLAMLTCAGLLVSVARRARVTEDVPEAGSIGTRVQAA